MRSALVACAALLLTAAAPGHAQTRELERRVDSLARMAQRARAALRAHDDSTRHVARTLDTARAATPVVIAAPPILAQTRAIAPIIVDSLESIFGSALSQLTGFTFGVQVQAQSSWRPIDDSTRELVVSIIRPNGAEMRAWRAPVDSLNIATSLHRAISYATFAVSDPALFAWAGNAIPHDTVVVSEWAYHRLVLVSAPSAVGKRCYDGDIEACRIALMLAPADPILEWHDRTSRQRFVRRHGELARRMDARAEQQCLAGADASCIAVLHLFPSNMFREPTPAALRFGVLRHAIAVGGAGAVERLLTVNAASPAERLAAAAGVPIDSLIGSWQSRVKAARAPSGDLTVGITIMSLAWATAMGALSLRSSRWR